MIENDAVMFAANNFNLNTKRKGHVEDTISISSEISVSSADLDSNIEQDSSSIYNTEKQLSSSNNQDNPFIQIKSINIKESSSNVHIGNNIYRGPVIIKQNIIISENDEEDGHKNKGFDRKYFHI